MIEKYLKTYLEDIINSDLSNKLIQKEQFGLTLTDVIDEQEFTTETNVITLDKLKTIQLVTKLETMIKIFEIMKTDNNVVFCDDVINEFDIFKNKVIPLINSVIEKEDTELNIDIV